MKAGQRCICDEAMDKRDGSMCEPCDQLTTAHQTRQAVMLSPPQIAEQRLRRRLLRTNDHGNQDP